MKAAVAETMADGAIGDALSRDIASTGRLLGVASVRASIVDLSTMTLGSTWTLAAQAEAPERGGDSVFAGASSTFSELADIGTEEMLLRRLSPRRWAFAWRLDEGRAVVGEAQFRERRETLDATTGASLRLLCNAGIRSRSLAAAGPAGGALVPASVGDELTWPQVERRARPKPSRSDITLLGISVAGVVLSGLLLLFLLPRWQEAHDAQATRVEQLVARGDRTAAQGLALAMASGDYGDVQSELQAFASLGYFSDALVTNTRQRVVAMVGAPNGQAMGAALLPELERRHRRLPLAVGSQEYGALWLPAVGETQQEVRLTVGTTAAGLLCVASLISALMLGWRLQRRRG